MARRRRDTIWLGKVSSIRRDRAQLAIIHDQFVDQLRLALDPSRVETSYNRTWRLAKPEFRDGVVFGKLGFARRSRTPEVEYDEVRHDWVTHDSPARQGNYSHFVIDLGTQCIAFEERPGDIFNTSFTRAMGKFLATGGLEIDLLSDTNTFETWLAQVDRVTRFYVSLKMPNPGFSKRADETRKIAEEIDAERLSIEAESETGLNVGGTILEGAAETAARGNGKYRASGYVGPRRRFYDSAKQFLKGAVEVTDDDSSETIQSKILDLLRDLAPEPDPPDSDQDA
jgi:hypothetical protein